MTLLVLAAKTDARHCTTTFGVGITCQVSFVSLWINVERFPQAWPPRRGGRAKESKQMREVLLLGRNRIADVDGWEHDLVGKQGACGGGSLASSAVLPRS